MPLASYRAYVGVAKDSINASITSAVVATATSLPIQNLIGTTGTLTTSGATYTAFIIDGVNTESTACTGNLTAGAIPVTALANNHSANVYVYFQLTASVGPTDYIPVEKFDPVDEYAQLMDKSMKGSMVETWGVQQGNRRSTWTMDGALFPDTAGYLMGAHFGADAITGAGPYTHKFSVNNAGTYQPTPYVLYFYDAVNTRVFAGSKCNEITLSLDPAQLVKFSAKWIGRASGVVANPTSSFSAIVPLPAWTSLVTLAGTATGKLQTFEVTLTRQAAQDIAALQGIQDPYSVWVGAEVATGKFLAVKEDDTLYNYYGGTNVPTQPTLTLASTVGTGAPQVGLTIQFTKTAVTSLKTLTSKSYIEEEMTFEGVANTTDGTPGTGSSPVLIQLVNAKSTAATFV